MTNTPDLELSQEFWNKRWEDNQTGWDIGYASPAITKYIDSITDKSSQILIPGCGNAYEANYLLENGFENITVIDIAPIAIQKVEEKFHGNSKVKIVQENFFNHTGTYDYIFEQTFFCAIDPLLRTKYVEKTFSLLKSNGKLVGVLFDKSFNRPGPPFGGSFEEYHKLFSTAFEISKLEKCYNSISPRQNTELFINFRKV